MDALTRTLGDKNQFPLVDWVNGSNDEVRSLLALARVVRVIGGSVSISLLAATLLIVHNTIRLTVLARRREIRIMQLVGATPRFIQLPLVLEGLFYGIAGAVAASGLLWFAGREVARFVRTLNSPLLANASFHISPLEFAAGLVAIGSLVGVFGSLLGARRFLRQK
jgi:cell division transport system permease protein